MRFRGTIRWLASIRGLLNFLWTIQVRLIQFREWAQGLTDQIHQASEQLAAQRGRPLIYLYSGNGRKDEQALQIAAADHVTEGLICVFKCVEPCHTFSVGPNPQAKKLELRLKPGKRAHYYFYVRHPQLGLIHLRLQAWLPFTMHVCLNGREWLAQQLLRQAIGFEQRDNCFVDVADVAAAQGLLDQQLRTNWDQLLGGLVAEYHPAHATLFEHPQLVTPLDIYWSAEQTEWATDVMFRSPEALDKVFPGFVRHAITHCGSEDVPRFLGRCPEVRRYSTSEIQTTLKIRPEGTCVKHLLNGNSVKMYNKQESVLRTETTINNPRDMRVYRTTEGDPQGQKSWKRLRKGVADLHRRTEVSRKSNERYLESLATVEHEEPLGESVRDLCRPITWQGQRVRALQPWSPLDHQLFTAVNRGEFAINGFRNRDLRPLLYGTAEVTAAEAKQQAARITRLLRLLRAHGLIQKVTKTHRYVLTAAGRAKINGLLIAQQASTKQLAQLAA